VNASDPEQDIGVHGFNRMRPLLGDGKRSFASADRAWQEPRRPK
jgi:hypothetical protein